MIFSQSSSRLLLLTRCLHVNHQPTALLAIWPAPGIKQHQVA
jgi:hypothetical protein